MRYELSDYEWTAIKPMLPNKPRGVRRVNDRRVLNGIFWVLRSGAPWRDLPENYGPRTTCYNRFVRWRRAGVWDRIMDALAAGRDVAVQMIDTSVVRVHQHGACIADNNHQDMGRSRGGPDEQDSRGGGHQWPAGRERHMSESAREFIDFWVENSIHAVEQYQTAGVSQDVAELTRRLVEAAKGQGISETDVRAEIGDITAYIEELLRAVNKAESERPRPT
ncbi:transposase [Bradyrhizobium japonicum]|uniref:Insertion element IS402-like domain-containing protein n=2 Tax=Bradyrhizobium TaxID=374 RepID=A0A1L3F8B3_BRAJP|nr:hypothetical protein BKD09_14495 [Bradyrhizobium japonicum]MCW2220978.1 transposase [Bradyrhizobium japonicum]MCW2345590.1 transposase [Bradyrhizobium japonicum]